MKFPLVLAAIVGSTALVGSAAEFGQDVDFLQKHSPVVVLSGHDGARVAVVPDWQGRVMTSSAAGDHGVSFGWINRELIATDRPQPHMNAIGGEDRFWLGPEGGQFSVFFAPKVPFDLAHWYTPAAVDTEKYAVKEQADDHVTFQHAIDLTNYSGTRLQLDLVRQVRVLDAAAALKEHHVALPAGVSAVAYESVNTIRNTGRAPWTRATGLLSIWILGMYNASPSATIIAPFQPGPDSELGPKVNTAYFGTIPADRLVVRDHVVLFRGDSHYRSKIGFSPRRASPVVGSYDADSHTLTLVSYTRPKGANEYVNSMWEIQREPFAGDVVNSYNDGPPAPGAKQLGHFFELESSSPALALAPGASATHTHQTIHLQGDEAALDEIARTVLGVTLKEVSTAFPH
ncbi:MAG TPA: DUF6786 family protein [Candidatus Didemnitutus sp.]|nr:DUF6786 family protein [Candidatus Didemnitutus sp.]